VVVALFNDLVTAKPLSGFLDGLCLRCIDTAASSSQLSLAWVPGSFESPLMAKKLASSSSYQVVNSLGS